MRLDARNSVFVFIGAWNPAIFQPNWILRYLFQVPEGEKETAAEVIATEPVPRRIIYIRNVGIEATSERVSIFANAFDEATVKRTEEVALRLVETLPHTPFGAFGINFRFVESEPDAELLDKLKITDGIEQHFKILGQGLTTTIRIMDSDDVVLNFSRRPSEKEVAFEFNYHHRQFVVKSAKDMLVGSVKKYLEQSEKILESLYALKGYDVIGHDFTKPGKQEAH